MNDRRRTKENLALAAIFVYSPARGEETEHYKIKQPIRQKSPLFIPRGRSFREGGDLLWQLFHFFTWNLQSIVLVTLQV